MNVDENLNDEARSSKVSKVSKVSVREKLNSLLGDDNAWDAIDEVEREYEEKLAKKRAYLAGILNKQ